MSTSCNENGRISFIDALKGFTILCVVLGHIANGNLWNPFSQTAYFSIYNIIYSFHMALFILLSGTVFYYAYCRKETGIFNATSAGNQKKRIGLQIAKLSILYVEWSLILGFFKMIFEDAVVTPVRWMDLLLIPVKPIKLYWYLFVLIIFYLFFGILRLGQANIAIMLVVTFALNICSNFLPAGMVFDVKRILYYAISFFAGIVLGRMKEKEISNKTKKRLQWLLLFFVVLSLVFCVVFWTPAKYLNERFLVNVIIAGSFSLGFYFLFQNIHVLGNSRFLGYLGKHCLEIYLVHTFALSAVRYLLAKSGITSTLLHVIIGMIAGILIPLLISFVSRKIHLYRVFFDPLRTSEEKKRN